MNTAYKYVFCSDSSDTSGLHNDRIIIETKEDNQIILDTFDSWRLSVNVVNEFIKDNENKNNYN